MEDYEADQAMCLTSVVFPPTSFCERIQAELIDPLRKLDPSHYYYPPQSLHVTIKNVRTIASPANFGEAEISAAQDVFATVVPAFPELPLSFEEVVAFGNSAAVVGYSDRSLGELILGLDEGLRKAELPDDKKYISDSVFFGSITLCRFRGLPSEEFVQRLSELSADFTAKLPVEVVDLVVCNAVCHSGSRQAIGSYRLCRR